MKILYVTNLYPPHHIGGYELICQTVNRAMQSRGHETRVLTSNHGIAEHGLPFAETGVERTLRIHGFFGHPWLGIRQLCELEVHNNNALRTAIAEFRPDVVHVFNLGGISKSLAHTLQRADVPAVYFVSDHWIAQSLAGDVWLRWWNRPDAPLWRRMLLAGLKICGLRSWFDARAPLAPAAEIAFRRIYFCSEFLRNQAVARGYDVAHAAVIRNAVDTKRFMPPILPRSGGCERFLFAGRLTAEKGVLTVLRALARIRDSFPGMLTICGQGEPAFEEELRGFVAEHRLPVRFIRAASAEMPEIYRQHDAFVFASEWEEPFALAPLEAMACGLPVIATTTGGSAELFRDRVNALTFTAGDDEALAARMLALHRESGLAARIGAIGCDQVRSEFREDETMDRVERYVRETVETWGQHADGEPLAAGRPERKGLAYA